MAARWRALVVFPLLLLTDRDASALEAEAVAETETIEASIAEKYATDTLVCRGPFTMRYVDKLLAVREHIVQVSKGGGADYSLDKHWTGTKFLAELQFDVTFATGNVGFGQDLAHGQCGWFGGKNPKVDGILVRGEFLEKDLLERTIEQDPTGKQTVSYKIPFSYEAKHSNGLFMFKVAHQGASGSSNHRVLVTHKPTVSYPTKFNTP
jgi:hypothetical protein